MYSASAASLLVLKLLKDVKWAAIRKLHLQEGSKLQTSSIVSNLQHLLAFSKTTGSGLFKFLRIDYSDFNILCNVLQQHVRTPIEKCFTNHSNASAWRGSEWKHPLRYISQARKHTRRTVAAIDAQAEDCFKGQDDCEHTIYHTVRKNKNLCWRYRCTIQNVNHLAISQVNEFSAWVNQIKAQQCCCTMSRQHSESHFNQTSEFVFMELPVDFIVQMFNNMPIDAVHLIISTKLCWII